MKKTFVTIATLFAVTLLTACGVNNAKQSPASSENTANETTTEIAAVADKETTANTVEPTAAPLSNEHKEPTTVNKTEKNTSAVNNNFAVTKNEAKAIVLKHAGLKETEISRYKNEIDKEINGTFYEIEFNANGYEYDYTVDVNTGKIVHNEKEKDYEPDKVNKTTVSSTPTKEPEISKDEAKAIVLKHAGLKEAEISRYTAELDKERNNLVYEIEFDAGKYEYEYEINAENGKIIKNQKEYRD